MSTAHSTASPRAPRGQVPQVPQPDQPAQQQHNNNAGKQPQRKPKASRAPKGHGTQNGTAVATGRPANGADQTVLSGEESQHHGAPRNQKKHTRAQPSIDRVFANGNAASASDSDLVTNSGSATPGKASMAYAGPTFHASPAPSTLPKPKFLSKSVPAKSMAEPPTPPAEDSSSSGDSPRSVAASPSRAPIAVPARHQDSPLDMLFKAHRAEKVQHGSSSPVSMNHFSPPNPHHFQRPPHYKQDSFGSINNNVFPMELDGQGKQWHASPPPPASRSVTDPANVPQVKDASPPNNGGDIMQDLLSRLSMSRSNPAPGTPPKPNDQIPSDPQTRHETPSPFHDGRPAVRSASGPSTPAAATQEPSDFFYGNRNLSPLFKAAQGGDQAKRNSGLRTEITADSPMAQQGFFQDVPVAPRQMNPNNFARDYPGSGGEGPANQPGGPRRGSVPFIPPHHHQNQQNHQSPNNRRRTPGRQQYQGRPDSYPNRGNSGGIGQAPGRGAHGKGLVTSPKPSTSMMSFVPASVAAKKHSTSTPPSGTPPPPAKSPQSDTYTIEQDLKRMLNLQPTGQSSGVQ